MAEGSGLCVYLRVRALRYYKHCREIGVEVTLGSLSFGFKCLRLETYGFWLPGSRLAVAKRFERIFRRSYLAP